MKPYTHFLNVTKKVFDTITEAGTQILHPLESIREGDEIIFEHSESGANEQKKVLVLAATSSEQEPGLKKGYYFVKHEMK